jgi:uroporphyrinogen decarboxylase
MGVYKSVMTQKTGKNLLDVALGHKPDRRPIWFLRQAGRYLPEYREVRSKVSFLELCKTPDLAAEVTIQPLRRYDLDASIIFSDILVPPTAMGQTLSFDAGEGPQLAPVIRKPEDLKKLRKPDVVPELGFVGEAIKRVKAYLKPHQTMIGFAGAPFTVASYMIEGEGSKNFVEVKRMAYTNPKLLRDLLDMLADVTIDYLKMQVAAGADIVMLFDTWAGQLPAGEYRELVYPATAKIFKALKQAGTPMIYFPGQGSDVMAELAGVDAAILAVDWRTRMGRARQLCDSMDLKVGLQGNLDPLALLAPEAELRSKVRSILTECGSSPHVFNVGHGLLPLTPPDSIKIAIDEVRRFNG